MITNQEVASRDAEGSPKTAEDRGAVPSSGGTRTSPTERVIAVFTAAARPRAGATEGPREGAFDAAVRAYIACYPDTCRDVAARIVADIISREA